LVSIFTEPQPKIMIPYSNVHMKVMFPFNKISNYFLEQYHTTDYVTLQKAKTLLAILMVILLIVCPSFIISAFMRELGPAEKIAPTAVFFSILIILVLLKKGKFPPAAHSFMAISLTALWLVMFLGSDKGNAIIKMDTIVLILGLMTSLPLIISRRARDVLIYFIINAVMLTLFVIYLKFEYNFDQGLITEYFQDNLIAMIFIGVISYQIFTIHRQALEKAKLAELEITSQNEELRASNEEFEAINEELIQSQQELLKREKALKESEERYRNIIQSIQEGYFEVDLKGRFMFVNKSLEEFSGYTMQELIGMDNRNYTTVKWSQWIYNIFNKIYRTGETEEIIDFEIINRNGEIKNHGGIRLPDT